MQKAKLHIKMQKAKLHIKMQNVIAREPFDYAQGKLRDGSNLMG